MWHFGIWFSSHVGVGLMVGLCDLKRSFPTYDSIILRFYETVPLDALLVGTFWMMRFLQLFSVSCPCPWSGLRSVMCRCQKVSVAVLFVLSSNWPKRLLSLCNTTATPEPWWCRFLTLWPFSYGQGRGKDLESFHWWSVFPAKHAHACSSVREGHKLSCHVTGLPALHIFTISMCATRSWQPVPGEALRHAVARRGQPLS